MKVFEPDSLFYVVGAYFLFVAVMVFLEFTEISAEFIAASFGILGLFFVLQGMNFKQARAKKR